MASLVTGEHEAIREAVEKFYRGSRVRKIVEGTSEIQKNIIYDNL
jgi:alkylation response protein AidB-like acyl-CoA dehydrogenase